MFAGTVLNVSVYLDSVTTMEFKVTHEKLTPGDGWEGSPENNPSSPLMSRYGPTVSGFSRL